MSANHISALSDALDRLKSIDLLDSTVAYLRLHTTDIVAELAQALIDEIPAYTESRNPAALSDMVSHGPQHCEEIIRLLAGGSVGDFQFVSDHARRRAEQRFPLEVTLHAYRCGHRVFSRWLRQATLDASDADLNPHEAVSALADFTIEYTNAISTVASSTYVEQTRLLGDVARDQRAQLLNILLDGYDEADGRVATTLRRAGYLDGRQAFCVVLAQSVDAREMTNPARARRLADAVEQLVPRVMAHRLIDVRDECVTCVFSSVQRQSGWTRADEPLAAKLASVLRSAGNGVLIGISADVQATARIPNARRQATLALQLAGPDKRVVSFSHLPMRRWMVHLLADDMQPLFPVWAEAFWQLDERQKGALSVTLRAYADADMNVLKAASSLAVHPNTLYSRFQKIQDVTGVNPRRFHGLSDLLMLIDTRA